MGRSTRRRSCRWLIRTSPPISGDEKWEQRFVREARPLLEERLRSKPGAASFDWYTSLFKVEARRVGSGHWQPGDPVDLEWNGPDGGGLILALIVVFLGLLFGALGWTSHGLWLGMQSADRPEPVSLQQPVDPLPAAIQESGSRAPGVHAPAMEGAEPVAEKNRPKESPGNQVPSGTLAANRSQARRTAKAVTGPAQQPKRAEPRRRSVASSNSHSSGKKPQASQVRKRSGQRKSTTRRPARPQARPTQKATVAKQARSRPTPRPVRGQQPARIFIEERRAVLASPRRIDPGSVHYVIIRQQKPERIWREPICW